MLKLESSILRQSIVILFLLESYSVFVYGREIALVGSIVEQVVMLISVLCFIGLAIGLAFKVRVDSKIFICMIVVSFIFACLNLFFGGRVR